jgi:hypothetical protein
VDRPHAEVPGRIDVHLDVVDEEAVGRPDPVAPNTRAEP